MNSLKVKMRKVSRGKTIDFHVIPIKTIDEIRFIRGPGISEGALEILLKTGHVCLYFEGPPKGELHIHVVGD